MDKPALIADDPMSLHKDYRSARHVSGSANSLKTPFRTSKTNPKAVTLPQLQHYDHSHSPHQGELEHGQDGDCDMDQSRQLIQQFRRVTAYCTAEFYNTEDLFQYLKVKSSNLDQTPVMYEEALYMLVKKQSAMDSAFPVDLDVEQGIGYIFVFEYGAVVFWGLEEYEEKKILLELKFFEVGSLKLEEVEVEDLRYHHNMDRPSRIAHDMINLKSNHHMFKLSISHAMAQSVKIAIYEEKINNCIGLARSISLALTKYGAIDMTRTQISKKMGELFDLRINVNLVLNVLDVPEIFWSKPSLEPFYIAARNYLEISQRVQVLNQKCEVISDMLDMMREQLNSGHSQKLEWIVIILIFFEILIGLFTGYAEFVLLRYRH